MPQPNPIYTQKPFSLSHMRRVFAMSDPVKLAAMAALMPWDYYYKAHEFDGTLDATYWTAGVTGGGAPTAFAYNAQRNGALRGATGATDDGLISLYSPNAQFDAADNPMMWVRFISPAAVTGFAFECGFSDPKTSEILPAVTALTGAAVPTVGNGVTDLAAVVMDTDLTLTTGALVGDGTTGAAAGVSLVNRAGTAWTPTASSIIDVIVGLSANKARCWIWDNLSPFGIMQEVTNGPDSGVLLLPYVQFRTRNTTSKTIDLLKIVIVAEEGRTA